jgi:hypothetical protein
MNASNWIIPALSALFPVSVVLAAGPSAASRNLEQRIRIQQERLPQIEQMAKQQREEVQQWYEHERATAGQERIREIAADFPMPERVRWIEYIRMYQDRPSTADYFDTLYFNVPFTYRAIDLPYGMMQEYTVSEMAALLQNESFRAKLAQVVDEEWQVPVLRIEAQLLLNLMDTIHLELTMELQRLERNKTARLDDIAKEEKNLQEQVRTILDYLRQSEQRKPQLGVVEAVGHSPQTGYYCVIEGIDRPLQPGDTARGVRVVSVDAQKVVFARNETTWAQDLGAPAQPQWD